MSLTLGCTCMRRQILCSQSATPWLIFNWKNVDMSRINYLGKTPRINWFFFPHVCIDWTAWMVRTAEQQIQLAIFKINKYALVAKACFNFFFSKVCFPGLMPNPQMYCWVHLVIIQKIYLWTTSEFSIAQWVLFILIKVSLLGFKVHLPNCLCSSAFLTV